MRDPQSITRRGLLATAAAAAASARWTFARDLYPDVRITRIVGFELLCRRPKFIGRNSYREPHGIEATDRMVRLYTNAGVEGVGTSTATQEECRAALGKTLADLWLRDERRMVGPFKRSTSAYWDLAGKLLGKPVYQLLGTANKAAAATVPVYDGSIYFVDLLPEHAADWPDELRRHLDLGVGIGHRAFKIKVGRGRKWMPQAEGDGRDLEVLRTIRKHVGPQVLLFIDANDGYDLPRTRKLLLETADLNLAFAEEMIPVKYDRFPEYHELRAFLRENKLGTLIADGENARSPDQFRDWAAQKAVDILQGDMNQFGFEDALAMSRLAETAGARIAPHNWGSLVGYYLQLHVGRSVPNFYRAEQDPMSSPALTPEGYTIKDGLASVPDAPGLSLRINEKAFTGAAKVLFDLKA